jgi:phosphatidate cytidylyltransferase
LLHWRIIIGAGLIALLAVLAWLDFHAPRPGVYLAPLALVASVLAADEFVRLFRHGSQPTAGDATPSRWCVVLGAFLVTLAASVPVLFGREHFIAGPAVWLALALVLAMQLSVLMEMLRYTGPGVSTARLARTVLGISYVGGLLGFCVQLRALGGGDGHWGMVALLSMIAVVKASDTGAYFTGRAIGKHKMTPLLSPGKTWQGAAGGFVAAALAAALTLGPMARAMGCVSERSFTLWLAGCIAYALVVGIAGVVGDLAISLLKRDAQLKDSSAWLPGFGGVLDLLDSILFAAPVAYVLWITRIVGP